MCQVVAYKRLKTMKYYDAVTTKSEGFNWEKFGALDRWSKLGVTSHFSKIIKTVILKSFLKDT